jgi:hypothetical protein
MPISFFEGIPDDQRAEVKRRNMERRFFALAAAVRDHEASARRATPASRSRDERLYRRLRQICGEPTTAEQPIIQVAQPPAA